MGWYDANPVNLNPLTPTESAQKWVEYMDLGSVDAVLRKAKEDYDAGEFQWVAEVTNTIVFADPDNQAARLLCADALEQLGYQAESGTWRNAYLSGAKELRTGNATGSTKQAKQNMDMTKNMTAANIFDYIGILLDKQAMANYDFTVNITIADTQQRFILQFKNGAVLQYENAADTKAALSITTSKNAIFYILQNQLSKLNEVAKIEGNTELLKLIMDNLNQFSLNTTPNFNIVEP